MSAGIRTRDAAPSVFDICGPLPVGTTVLEASAGTGKTFTIAALAARYVAEGRADLSDLLLITFGRAATTELRDRVRSRLIETERELRRDDARESRDASVRALAAVDDAELARRRDRLARAVASFDAATIATTHGFCQQALRSLGVLGDTDADAVLVPDLAELVDEVVDDLYLGRYAAQAQPELTVDDARAKAVRAIGDPQAALDPHDPDPASPAGHRVAFARAARSELEARKRRNRILDYDDLLELLRRVLADPQQGPEACERLQRQFRVVLVDEFQDTDPVQWEILRLAFSGACTLVLIGDPKQAIYGFRGGDVVAYLQARAAADTVATLGRNWRSDEPLLRGLDALLGGVALGDPRILVHPLDAHHRTRRISGGPPVRLRHLHRSAFTAGRGDPAVADIRIGIAADTAADVVRQLGSVTLRGPDGTERDLRPADIAVLCWRNQDTETVRDALVSRGVPAVISGMISVFDSPGARDWLTLLSALEQPSSRSRAAAVALTPFVGWNALRLANAADADRDELSDRIRRWAQLLADRGIMAVLEAALADGLGERLLGSEAGERTFTDLRHVAQAAHAAALDGDLGPAALTDWLRRRVTEAGRDYAEERSRRLETDAAAVQVVTVHASKGLEFPLVYVPFAWNYWATDPDVPRYHDATGGRRLWVGGDAEGYAEACARDLDDSRGEDLRLLYVALTRASSAVVVTWALAAKNSPGGPLTRLLLGGGAPGQIPPACVDGLTDEAAAARFADLAQRSARTVALDAVTAPADAVRWAAGTDRAAALEVAQLRRRIDLGWVRSSYTRITSAAHAAAGVASEPETTVVEDEPELAPPEPDSQADPGLDLPSPMADLPGGAAFGTLVHAVLERVDPTANDLEREIAQRCAELGRFWVPDLEPARLAAALTQVLATPLGPLAAGVALRDVAPTDRLTELEFELPLAGGDAAGADGADLSALAGLLRTWLPPGDVFAGYADRLADLDDQRLRGYLTGSLDAVLRLRVDGQPRYLVVDYKTNRLGAPERELTAFDYRPGEMARAMQAAHYPLQLLLYSVALHRYLRWRQPGYDPEVHLGGGLYLFVRGMCGPQTPVVGGSPCGVLGWRPPTGLVLALSSLLDGQRP
jgi:exodeoxyribonuclease V beta subunit